MPLEKKICPNCDGKLQRRPECYHWRGVTVHGWICEPCNALWDLNSAFIRYVEKRVKKEGASPCL